MSITGDIFDYIGTNQTKKNNKITNKNISALQDAAHDKKAAYRGAANSYINSLTNLTEQQNRQMTASTQSQIEGTRQQYQKAYDYNAINSELQQRQVADRMANLGLSDSGLNMTNQTAMAVSRMNNDASITQKYNNDVSTLRSNLQQYLAENNRTLAQNVAQVNYDTKKTLADITADYYDEKAALLANNAKENVSLKAENRANAKSITQSLISSVTSTSDKTKNAQTIFSAAKTYGLTNKSIKKLLSYAGISWNDYNKWIKNRDFFSNASKVTSSSNQNNNYQLGDNDGGGDSFEETTDYKNALKTMSLHFRSPSSSKLNKKDVTSYIKQLKKTYSLTDAQVEKLTEIITDRYDLE